MQTGSRNYFVILPLARNSSPTTYCITPPRFSNMPFHPMSSTASSILGRVNAVTPLRMDIHLDLGERDIQHTLCHQKVRPADSDTEHLRQWLSDTESLLQLDSSTVRLVGGHEGAGHSIGQAKAP